MFVKGGDIDMTIYCVRFNLQGERWESLPIKGELFGVPLYISTRKPSFSNRFDNRTLPINFNNSICIMQRAPKSSILIRA